MLIASKPGDIFFVTRQSPLDKYKRLRTITEEKVDLVEEISTGKLLIMKLYNEGQGPQFEHELGINLTIQRTFQKKRENTQIVQMHSYKRMSRVAITGQYYGFITLPYKHNGDLLEFLKKQLGILLSSQQQKILITSMVSAVHEMHTKVKASHMDIKLQNFVFADNNQDLLLIDFGFSLLLSYTYKYSPGYGTYSFMAPEVHSSDHFDCLKADIISLGVCMLAVTTLGNPFPRKTE